MTNKENKQPCPRTLARNLGVPFQKRYRFVVYKLERSRTGGMGAGYIATTLGDSPTEAGGGANAHTTAQFQQRL